MKSLFYHMFFLFLVSLSLSSCYKDKGNYDIAPVDVIKIGGPSYASNNYTLVQSNTLNIKPEFTFTGDPETLEYTWKVYPASAKTGDPSIQTISNAKELVYEIKLPVADYSVLLEIKDPKTGVVRSKTYGLKVTVRGAQGFLVLNTKEGNLQDIDVIPNNAVPGGVIYGVFSTNNKFELKDALKLKMCLSLTYREGNLYVLGKTGGYMFNQNYVQLQEAKNWFFDVPEQIIPSAMYHDGLNTFIINNGSVHTTYSAAPPALFTFRTPGNYKTTKAVFMGTRGIIYDELNHRFLKCTKSSAATIERITVNPADAFDVDAIGNKTCLHFDHNKQPATAATIEHKPIAYCKDNESGKVFAYKFGLYRSLVTYAESVTEVTAPGFATATAYVSASNNQLTYYAAGNKIYVYDSVTDIAREVYAFADNNVSIDRLMTNGQQLLAVANSKTGNSGAVYFFKLEGTGSFEGNTHFSKYDGFGKIQDVEYKFSAFTGTAFNWK